MNMILVRTVCLLISIPMIATFGNSDYAEQGRRKLANDNPAGFISIDCGARGDSYDKYTGLYYKSDTEFIDTGTNMGISPEFMTEDMTQILEHVRSFPEGRKNCYTLKPVQGKNNNYLFRAFFMYGNYDGKNLTPSFDIYLGVNRWMTVNLTDPSTIVSTEIIHFSLTDNINVCLVNTGQGIPFISALELRLLNTSIYRTGFGGLQMHARYDVAGSNFVRYPADIYDRTWDVRQVAKTQSISNPSTIDIQSSNDSYYPPAAVLRTAAQTQNSTTPIAFSLTLDPSYDSYIYFHFAEIEQQPDGQLRELNISLNGEYPLTEPIKLEYLKPLTVGPLNSLIKDTFDLQIYGTKESNLPPILNAFEIFLINRFRDSPTDQEDVDAIMGIKQVYKVTRNWQGDPCVPGDYLWDGLNCSYDNPPRIISLNLASSGLTGKIASSLSNLKSIESLDLSNNSLTGPVPEFFAQLPSLRTINLTGNKLSGPIPQAVMEKVNNGSLNLSSGENPNLCPSDSCKAVKKFVVPIVASVGSVLLLFLLSALVFWYCKRKKQESYRKRPLTSKTQEFTYSEIASITCNFKTVIGEGGFGKVYLGTLKNGNPVAVKVHSSSSRQGPVEFQTEAQLLMRVHHRNLVSIIGYCSEGTHMALIYEYMGNGNLRQHLSETNANVLNWQQRLQIAIDAAQGLEYLHNGCKPPIIHRDMKTANILLNERMQAKIADFGLSRDFKNESDSHISIALAGTPAYIDPEYWGTGKFNKKSDVYSFGIVLLELVTGHSAVVGGDLEYINIIQWVTPIFEREDIESIVDQKLQGDFDTNCARKVVEIAMSCIPSTAIQRPDISYVVAELKECLAIEMASKGTRKMVSIERRPNNSHDVNLVELETQIASLAR